MRKALKEAGSPHITAALISLLVFWYVVLRASGAIGGLREASGLWGMRASYGLLCLNICAAFLVSFGPSGFGRLRRGLYAAALFALFSVAYLWAFYYDGRLGMGEGELFFLNTAPYPRKGKGPAPALPKARLALNI